VTHGVGVHLVGRTVILQIILDFCLTANCSQTYWCSAKQQ